MKNQTKGISRALKHNWYVWIFPAIAIGFSIWLFADYLNKKGPKIQITFDDGSAIQPDKTKIRYRGVTIGTVTNLFISKDGKDVIAEAELHKDAEQFAVKGSKFWIVSPRVGFQGVSGLETLFEGTYIAATPGPEEGDEEKSFKGKQAAENADSLDDTSAYLIETPNAETVNSGDSVTFRGLKVGSVTKVGLASGSQLVQIQINIHNRYVHLVRTNTAFWRKLAVQAKLGLFHSELKVNSLDSIMNGGIEMFTPDNPGPIAKALTKFQLEPSAPKGSEKWNPRLN